MFLVAMTIAVLASVGVYALSAASNELRTSGNERQNTQTHYLAEYGIIGTAHQLDLPLMAGVYYGAMTNPSTVESVCLSLPGVPATANVLQRACRRLEDNQDFQPYWPGTTITATYAGAAPYTPGVAPGSFGATPMTGDFFVELTEPLPVGSPARFGLNNGLCFIKFTVSATGITRPIFAWQQGADQSSQFGGEGLEMQRARLIGGPTQCQ